MPSYDVRDTLGNKIGEVRSSQTFVGRTTLEDRFGNRLGEIRGLGSGSSHSSGEILAFLFIVCLLIPLIPYYFAYKVARFPLESSVRTSGVMIGIGVVTALLMLTESKVGPLTWLGTLGIMYGFVPGVVLIVYNAIRWIWSGLSTGQMTVPVIGNRFDQTARIIRGHHSGQNRFISRLRQRF